MENLRPRERKVLDLRFGLTGNGTHSLRQIGHLLRISKERVRQIQNRALEKLRPPPNASAGSRICSSNRRLHAAAARPLGQIIAAGNSTPPPVFFSQPRILQGVGTLTRAGPGSDDYQTLVRQTESNPCRRTMSSGRSIFMSARFIRIPLSLLLAVSSCRSVSAQAITYDFEVHPSNQTWYLPDFSLGRPRRPTRPRTQSSSTASSARRSSTTRTRAMSLSTLYSLNATASSSVEYGFGFQPLSAGPGWQPRKHIHFSVQGAGAQSCGSISGATAVTT